MASINFGWFSDNWFQKPSNPISPLNLLVPIITQTNNFLPPNNNSSPNFALISGSSLFGKWKRPSKGPPSERTKRLFEQYISECENPPDYRHTPQVEAILKEEDEDDSSIVEKKENPTEEEIKENEKWWEEFSKSPVVQFLKRAEEIDDKINEMELKANELPYRKEDRELWKALPHVPGLDGRPMPRKAIRTDKQSDDKFWDFTRQFFFGLWGFKQRPYPTSRPIDVAQAIGYQRLEKRYYDFIMKSGGFFYKDRLGRSRGPSELIQLKTAWAGGIIDKDTFIWGEDMDEWAPIHMVYGLEKAIATWDVRLGASATAFYHKLTKGIPPWVPLKGHEKKTYKQLQEEAIESKRRDLAVMEANGGIWPGVKIPSHALFLWASGSELTTMLEADHMPNKYVPKDLRIKLAKAIPGLRPWEVLSVEQAMDRITYRGEWYRSPLGSYTTGPPYIKYWNRHVLRIYRTFRHLVDALVEQLQEQMPGFSEVVRRVKRFENERIAKRLQKIRAKQKREQEIAIYGKPLSRRSGQSKRVNKR